MVLESREITEQIVGAAFEVHSVLGYGFLEKVYQRAMQVELVSRKLKAETESEIQVRYKRVVVGDYQADLLVEDKVIVEAQGRQGVSACGRSPTAERAQGDRHQGWPAHQLRPHQGRVQAVRLLSLSLSVFHPCFIRG